MRKRQATGALQDASRNPSDAGQTLASWSAAALRRFFLQLFLPVEFRNRVGHFVRGVEASFKNQSQALF